MQMIHITLIDTTKFVGSAQLLPLMRKYNADALIAKPKNCVISSRKRIVADIAFDIQKSSSLKNR